MHSYFPDALRRELEQLTGCSVDFDRKTLYPPLAKVPRLVFCPQAFDFPRSRGANVVWAGPYVDDQRLEPDFPWQKLEDQPFAYCAFGTQSMRCAPVVAAITRTIVRVFSQRDDLRLVIVPALPGLASHSNTDRVLAVARAPQLSLLRKAKLALIHAGFNSLKECAASGVPILALPLSHDQPRNAALVQYHGIGLARDPRQITESELGRAITQLRDCPQIRAKCQHIQALFAREAEAATAGTVAYLQHIASARLQARSIKTTIGVC
jgi:UDP:flavonoid glycosyltransferase YjiC (YdhE family)